MGDCDEEDMVWVLSSKGVCTGIYVTDIFEYPLVQ